MARKLVLLGVLMIVVSTAVMFVWRRPPLPPAPGVPLTLAQDRASRITDLRYDVSFTVPLAKTDAITGRMVVTFNLSDRDAPLAFDFAQPADHLTRVTANGHAVASTIQNGHVVIPVDALTDGANSVRFEFKAGDESLNRHDDFLYTLFVPARASLAMPCLDQPDLKARWHLSLDIPAEWVAVANGAEEQRTTSNGRAALTFAETKPLPTYLFAFATGKFSIDVGARGGRLFRMFHRETDAVKVAKNRDAIFDLHAKALDWLEDYTGIPYPFGKLDFVLIPSFQFGGMEHAGAILYNASGLMLDDSATQNQRLNRANVISHETSHMWFGDLVTMKWFDDVWMKEVFANFMAAKIVNPSFPDVNHELRFLLQNYPVAYDVDRTDGANPIRQSLANLNEAGSLYGAIIYQKAPIVMRQLEFLVGADAFRDGVRTYLRRYAFGNATWPDLISELDARKPRNLPAWSHAWVDEPGRPTVKTELQASDGKIRRLVFHQEDPRNRALAWPQRIQVLLGYPTKVEAIDVSLEEAATAVPEAAGRDTPIWILPVGRGLGYGLFDLDPATLEYFTSSLAKIADPLTRGSALVTVWEAMLEGQVPPARVRDMLLSSLPRETNELNVQQMLTYLRQSFWRFTPIGTRPSVAGQVEHVIKDGLDAATSQSLKAAWFGALRNVALTPMTVNWLERVWKHDVTIPGLTFSESDDADLALDLAVRDVPDTPMILRTQLERFRNPDRKARFAFVIPAVSGDATTRLRFFDSLKDARNRQHEAWVLDAATYLHHPLRARESQALVRPALDLVLEIQRTGDIFFPKRWADATLGGYQTHQVATDVRAFLDGLPADYPPRLRWVVLSAADMLFRASRLAAPKNE